MEQSVHLNCDSFVVAMLETPQNIFRDGKKAN
jgi:hypothetical protein